MDKIAWIVLRIVFAWMFLYPLIALFSDWQGTVAATGLLFKKFTQLFAIASCLAMIVGALSILFGIYAQIGGFILLFFNFGGAIIHYRSAGVANGMTLSSSASADDQSVLTTVKTIAVIGHTSSAQKNFVLAAVSLFFVLMGSGPLSLTGNIF